MKYQQDIFYSFEENQFLEIVDWAVKNSKDVRIDKLEDNRVRQPTNLTLEDYLQAREKSTFVHDVVIHRRGYDDWKDNEFFPTNWCIEIGSCTIDLFLFIYVDISKLEELILKFNLTI